MTAKFRVVPHVVTAELQTIYAGTVVVKVNQNGKTTLYNPTDFQTKFSPENAEGNEMWRNLYGYPVPYIPITTQEPLLGQGGGSD